MRGSQVVSERVKASAALALRKGGGRTAAAGAEAVAVAAAITNTMAVDPHHLAHDVVARGLHPRQVLAHQRILHDAELRSSRG